MGLNGGLGGGVSGSMTRPPEVPEDCDERAGDRGAADDERRCVGGLAVDADVEVRERVCVRIETPSSSFETGEYESCG